MILVAPGRRNPGKLSHYRGAHREILVTDRLLATQYSKTVSPSWFLPEPADELTYGASRWKMTIPAFVRMRAHASQVLGCAGFHSYSSSRELALWRQHLLCRGAAG